MAAPETRPVILLTGRQVAQILAISPAQVRTLRDKGVLTDARTQIRIMAQKQFSTYHPVQVEQLRQAGVGQWVRRAGPQVRTNGETTMREIHQVVVDTQLFGHLPVQLTDQTGGAVVLGDGQ